MVLSRERSPDPFGEIIPFRTSLPPFRSVDGSRYNAQYVVVIDTIVEVVVLELQASIHHIWGLKDGPDMVPYLVISRSPSSPRLWFSFLRARARAYSFFAPPDSSQKTPNRVPKDPIWGTPGPHMGYLPPLHTGRGEGPTTCWAPNSR